MLQRLNLSTLLFFCNLSLYGQDYAIELSNTFREVPSFWLLHPSANSLSAQTQHRKKQWSWGQLCYTEVRYSPVKRFHHRARLTLSTHTGPDALLDYPYTLFLPYGFPQAFSLGQVELVNSLTIRWQRGVRVAILHNSKFTKEDSLHRIHLQIELSLH